jgi:GT2 family glycosyltransferase
MLTVSLDSPRIDVSICVANYNGEHILSDCLDSIFTQDTDAKIEILVHDDASQDGSIALLRERYPQAQVLESSENVGFCVSNNRMADKARGNYLLLLNNDAALQPDAIRHLLAAAGSIETPSILTLPQYGWEDGSLINRGCRLDISCYAVPVVHPRPVTLAMVEGACMFLPARLWKDIGGFPTCFGSIAEDAFLCSAARLLGARIDCLATSGYRHRQGASFGGNRLSGGKLSTRYRRRYLSERNRIKVLAICTPTVLAWPWLMMHCALLMAEAAALCVLLGGAEPWRVIYAPALRDNWKHRGQIRVMRRALQAKRCIGLRNYLQGFVCFPQKLRLLMRHGVPRFKT